MQVLKKVDDIAFCQLTSQDVVRHPLVQKIVKAYEEYENRLAVREKIRRPGTGDNRTRTADGCVGSDTKRQRKRKQRV